MKKATDKEKLKTLQQEMIALKEKADSGKSYIGLQLARKAKNEKKKKG